MHTNELFNQRISPGQSLCQSNFPSKQHLKCHSQCYCHQILQVIPGPQTCPQCSLADGLLNTSDAQDFIQLSAIHSPDLVREWQTWSHARFLVVH